MTRFLMLKRRLEKKEMSKKINLLKETIEFLAMYRKSLSDIQKIVVLLQPGDAFVDELRGDIGVVIVVLDLQRVSPTCQDQPWEATTTQ